MTRYRFHPEKLRAESSRARPDKARHLFAAAMVIAAIMTSACSSSNDNKTLAKANSQDTTSDLDNSVRDDPQIGASHLDDGDKQAEQYPGYSSEVYSLPESWLCNPNGDVGACNLDLDTTVVYKNGTTTDERFEAASDPGFDCFYVYPTISSDGTPNSDMNVDQSERGVIAVQFARFGSVCRTFAPIYRQVTLAVISGAITGGDATQTDAPDREMPYNDVLDAFKHFIANESHGRPFLLIGHSQGAGILNRLVKEEIDNNASLRARMLSAMIIGASVAVPEGKKVGGDFQNVPACESDTQTGCVISYASFKNTAPPQEGAFFGKPRTADGVALCTNPAALSGGSAELKNYMTNNGDNFPNEPDKPQPATKYVSFPGLISGECQSENGYNFLQITYSSDETGARKSDLGGELTPAWGLHLLDMNFTMGNLLDIANAQFEAYSHTNR